MKPDTREEPKQITVSLEYIRSHNMSAQKLMGAFELLRDIEEQRLKVIRDTVDGLPDAVLVNIRKSQQDVWMYTGIIEELSRLYFTPQMNGGA